MIDGIVQMPYEQKSKIEKEKLKNLEITMLGDDLLDNSDCFSVQSEGWIIRVPTVIGRPDN